jgi:hypothetical protein
LTERDWYDPEMTYECAFCGEEIEHDAFDPCEVEVQAARSVGNDAGTWFFWAHAACVPAAFHEGLRTEVTADYRPREG